MWTRVLRSIARQLCRHLGWTPITTANFERSHRAQARLFSLLERSGFLRDGRYPGGRQAERRIKRCADKMKTCLRAEV